MISDYCFLLYFYNVFRVFFVFVFCLYADSWIGGTDNDNFTYVYKAPFLKAQKRIAIINHTYSHKISATDELSQANI